MLKLRVLLTFILVLISNNFKTINYKLEIINQYQEDYLAKLEIPKIKLIKKLYSKNSSFNNVDINLMMIGDTPGTDTKVIIAGHSGYGSNAYFNDLIYLDIDDEIIVYYKNEKYVYKISKIYDIEKTGKIYLEKSDVGIIALITCRIGTNMQTVYKGYLK